MGLDFRRMAVWMLAVFVAFLGYVMLAGGGV
jgi:hypothetical protein